MTGGPFNWLRYEKVLKASHTGELLESARLQQNSRSEVC